MLSLNTIPARHVPWNKGVDISIFCPILQQLMSKLMVRRVAKQRIHGLAQTAQRKRLRIWPSIADRGRFWTSNAEIFSAQ